MYERPVSTRWTTGSRLPDILPLMPRKRPTMKKGTGVAGAFFKR
jgi:hypothetical protein